MMSPADGRLAGLICAALVLAWFWVRCWLEQVDDNLADLED